MQLRNVVLGSCEREKSIIWTDIYIDDEFKNDYDEINRVEETKNLFVTLNSLDICRLQLKKYHQDQYREKIQLQNSKKTKVKRTNNILHEEEEETETTNNLYEKTDQDDLNFLRLCNEKNKEDFIPVIERVNFCFSEHGKIVPFDVNYPYETGCNTQMIDIIVCTLYEEEQESDEFIDAQFENNEFVEKKQKNILFKPFCRSANNGSQITTLLPEKIQKIYDFTW
jgi:hypothetical protein